MSKPLYESPLSGRYATPEMLAYFSPDHKYRTWRKLWIALAESEKELGLPITEEQIAELKAHADTINYEDADEFEKSLRHDVMAHIRAYAKQCPKAAGVIHLGATSCFVTDNADILIMRDALELIREKLVVLLYQFSKFASEYRALPCLGYTHLQPAQPTTVGKRATLWAYDFLQDYAEIVHRLDSLRLLGNKGTTGTQASFLELFEGNSETVDKLESRIAEKLGFAAVVPVSGQTYSRKIDAFVAQTLSGIAQSAHKFATDLRLLQSFKELEEPFEKDQVGSSAMPYKRNPMRCERICALSRVLIGESQIPAQTHSVQWLERTLDDSAAKRLCMPECFLLCDSILNLLLNVTGAIVVNPYVIRARLDAELPFMASENILMRAVKKGGDRQKLHAILREHSLAAANAVKREGKPNDLIARISADPRFSLSDAELSDALDPALYVGRAPEQVDRFLINDLAPVFDSNASLIAKADSGGFSAALCV